MRELLETYARPAAAITAAGAAGLWLALRPAGGDVPAWAVVVVVGALLAFLLAREQRARRSLAAEAAERDRYARALAESERRFRLALDASRVMLFSQDRELRCTWTYNPQRGLTEADIVGRLTSEVFNAAEAERIDAVGRQVLATGQGLRREVEVSFRGRPVFLDLKAEPLHDEDGAVVGVICAAIDVTRSRLARLELQRARLEAVRAGEAKSRFLAAASHDLRQPFQAMTLFHQLLADRLQESEDRDVCARLGEALDAGRQLLSALLDVSTLDAALIEPRISTFVCGEVVAEAAGDFAGQAEAKGLDVRVLPARVPVRSDPVLLQRMLGALLSNAVRFTDSGRILVGCRRAGRFLRIEVWDTGCGIPAEQAASIFEDFYQVGNPERDRNNGLGLGLALVERLGRLLGHEISVRSWLGRGSVFAVSLPVAADAVAAEIGAREAVGQEVV